MCADLPPARQTCDTIGSTVHLPTITLNQRAMLQCADATPHAHIARGDGIVVLTPDMKALQILSSALSDRIYTTSTPQV